MPLPTLYKEQSAWKAFVLLLLLLSQGLFIIAAIVSLFVPLLGWVAALLLFVAATVCNRLFRFMTKP